MIPAVVVANYARCLAAAIPNHEASLLCCVNNGALKPPIVGGAIASVGAAAVAVSGVDCQSSGVAGSAGGSVTST